MSVSARQTFVITLTAIVTLVLAYLIWWLAEIVLLLLGSIIFASAIQPYVTALSRRGIRQGFAILIVYALVLLFIITLIIVAVPPLISFLISLVSSGQLTTQLTQLATRLAIFGWDQFQVLIPVVQLPSQLNAILEQTGEEVQRQAWTFTQSTAIGLGQALLLFTMAFYWLTSREQTLALLLLLSPRAHRPQVHTIWNAVEYRLGAYVRGQIILMAIIGLASFVVLFALRVPYAPALALIAGLTEAIPMVGPLLGAVPAVIIGFTVSPWVGLAVAAAYMFIQFTENNVLVPRIMSSNVGLNPLVVIIAIVAGSTINGVVGAVLAIPLAGALQVIVQLLWLTPAIATLAPDVVGAGGEEESPAELTPDVDMPDAVLERGDPTAEEVSGVSTATVMTERAKEDESPIQPLVLPKPEELLHDSEPAEVESTDPQHSKNGTAAVAEKETVNPVPPLVLPTPEELMDDYEVHPEPDPDPLRVGPGEATEEDAESPPRPNQ